MTRSVTRAGPPEAWPALPWRDWEPTISTLHMWAQIVGKVRMALTPPLPHWWHVALYVTPRGLTTTAIPNGHRSFQVDLDFVEHRLQIIASDPGSFTMALEPKSVARFYREFMDGLAGLGIDVRISTKPFEVVHGIRFDADEQHASYEPRQVEQFWRGLLQADRVMKMFQSEFTGQASPVHFFWGSFDLATARYSSVPATPPRGGAPDRQEVAMGKAHPQGESSIGWWPASVAPGPAFYSYTYPEPDGFRSALVRPAAAYFDAGLGEFLLPYDAVRGAPDPDAAVLEFFESTYIAGADHAGWNRSGLEPAQRVARPPNGMRNTFSDASPNAHGHSRSPRPSSHR